MLVSDDNISRLSSIKKMKRFFLKEFEEPFYSKKCICEISQSEDRGKETTRNIFYCAIDANFKNCIEKILFESQKKMEYLYKYFNPFFKDTKEVNREKSKQLFKENFSLSNLLY